MESRDPRKVFEVMDVQNENDNIWILYRLTYDTIAVGDTLYILDQSAKGETKRLPVEILKILVFENREISEVDRGYYCKLYVVGETAGNLKEKDYLYLK